MLEHTKILDIEELLETNSLSCDDLNIKKLKSFIDDYKQKNKQLETILKVNDEQQLQIIKLNDKLKKHKHLLEKQVKSEKRKRKIKEKLLIQQSKLAEMGQMIDSIAHQWIQPLSIIQIYNDSLFYTFEADEVNEDFVQDFYKNVSRQIDHLKTTLNEFRNFYRPEENNENFQPKDIIDSVMTLIKDEFIKYDISIEINDDKNFYIHGNRNEFKHLFINLFNNSKDAFNDNNIHTKKNIIVNIDSNTKEIEIIDNAGGIKTEVLDKIFELNVTSKKDGKGTGVGLYFVKKILDKNNAKIYVSNTKDGAKFTIKFNA